MVWPSGGIETGLAKKEKGDGGMSSFNRNRAPLGEATTATEIANRNNNHGGGNACWRSRSRQRMEPRKKTARSPHAKPKRDDATRARVYKAEAYEAKVRIASQQQQIEALKAELEEVKSFQNSERRDGGDAEGRQKDAELIEALANELETMEKDMKLSQARVRELEDELSGRLRSVADERAAHTREKARWEKERELKERMERQKKGYSLEMDRLKRREAELKDDMECQRGEFNAEKARWQSREAEAKAQMERDRRELSSEKAQWDQSQTMLLEQSTAKARWEQREAEMKNQLERQSRELMDAKKDAKEGIFIMKELEGALRKAHTERDEALSQMLDLRRQMKQQIQDEAEKMQNERDESQLELSSLRAEVKRLSECSSKCEVLKKALETLQKQYEKQIDQSNQVEIEAKKWEEKLKKYRLDAKAMTDSMEGQHDELLSENKRLKAENENMAAELNSKALELHDMQSNIEEEREGIAAVKKDYTSAVDLTISRGLKIESLEEDVKTYRSHLAKALRKIKKLEKKSLADAESDMEQVQIEVLSLRTNMTKSEETIAALRQELTLKGQLEADLRESRKEHDESQSKIRFLEEALRDMEDCNPSSRSLGSTDHDNKRRISIEANALKEYCSYRTKTGV